MTLFQIPFVKVTYPKFFFSVALLLVLILCNHNPVSALENGLARTPPMGWNPWNVFKLNINETIMKEMADKLVSTGLAKAGYNYVVIDNGWYNPPNANSVNTTRFPSGIKSLADYVHAKGLKLGIYTAWDSEGKEARDAAQWAAWEVDFVKHDAWKNTGAQTAIWTNMRDAILATKRPMLYSIHFKDSGNIIAAPNVMNMWRFTNDLVPYYNRAGQPGLPSWGITTVEIVKAMGRVAESTGPGAWADADMLMVGIGKQTMDEWKTAFAIECLLPSPLMISADIRTSPNEILDIFLNEELIAVNQDTLGSKSWRIRADGLREVWARRLGDSSFAVVFINMDNAAAPMQVTWSELKGETGRAKVRDLWLKKDVGPFTNSYSTSVPTHGTAFLKITPERFSTGLKNSGSSRAKKLQPHILVRAEKNAILVSLNQITGESIKASYSLSTLSGKKISSRPWSNLSGAKSEQSFKIPGNIKTGMYIVSFQSENPKLNLTKEIFLVGK